MTEQKYSKAEAHSRIALIGNPNTGKTTLFNCLTGLRQRVGNYPGVTVQRKIGQALLGTSKAEIVDLPGTYSLSAASPDERVVYDDLMGCMDEMEKPDLALCIVDATNLQRNLFIVYQVAQLGIPVVLAVNHWDSAKKRHIEIDLESLGNRLGVPVLAISAARAEGIAELKSAIESALQAPRYLNAPDWPDAVPASVAAMRDCLKGTDVDGLSDAALLRAAFDGDSELMSRAGVGAQKCGEVLEIGRQGFFKAGLNPQNAEAVLLHRHIKDLVKPCINLSGDTKSSGSESIDGILTHKWWGLVAFLGLMYLVFQSVYSWAAPFMDLIDGVKGWGQDMVSSRMEPWPMLQSLVADGVIEGVGAVFIFLPQILILFFFITLLEDTGYMARAAFLMDKLFSWCGLSGKSFVPLLSSYACAIPGVMATRTIQDPKARLVTILLAPFMSCSARLPVYVLMIGAFIEPRHGAAIAGMVLFLMHFVGLVVAMPFVYVANRYLLKTPPQPFLLELPSYQVPKFRDVVLRMYSQGKEFVVNAGTVIFAITIVIWAMLYFPRSEEVADSVRESYVAEIVAAEGLTVVDAHNLLEKNEEYAAALDRRVSSAYIEQSIMGRFGRFAQPVFEASGFDWKITVGVLASFPAREVIISTLGIIYSLGGDVDEESHDLRDRMAAQTWPDGEKAGQPVFTIPVVLSIMVFFALCQQCGATLAVIAHETSWKWSVLSFGLMTSLAWVASVVVFRVGALF